MAEHESKSAPHSNQMATFITVFLMLIALTGLSFWIANSALMENRTTAWAAMLGVSIAKSLLVILFFMHLWWERAWKYVLTVPSLILATLLVMLLWPDIALRTENYSQQRTHDAAAPRAIEH